MASDPSDGSMTGRFEIKDQSNHSSCSTASKNEDAAAECRLVHKIDLHLIPILFVLYLATFVDRINIGNARIQGLEADLGMDPKSSKFNIALTVFFVPYILLEVPSNIILKRIRPPLWFSLLMLGWGIITVAMGCVQSFAGLVACRFLLGVFEAGFLPGAIYLISMYYKRFELQRRINIFWCSTFLAGAISGLLAYALAKMDGVGGFGGWRWIFIIEGLATIVLALTAYFLIPDWPQHARFLNNEERELLHCRLSDDSKGVGMNTWSKRTARRVFSDIKIWLGAVAYLGMTNSGYSVAFFAPTILHQLGPQWTVVRSQVMTIPVYIVGATAALATAWLTDRIRHRFGFILFGCCFATVGYVILLNMAQVSANLQYGALFFILGGTGIAQPVTVVWLNNNMGGHIKRGMSSSLQISIGNCAGIIASNIFLPRQKPRYPLGYSLGLGLVWLCALCSTLFFGTLWRENQKRSRGERDYRLDLPQEELENLGDDHPSFRFTY